MASSSSCSNQHVTVEVLGEEEYSYPYPSNLSAASFISVKLSGRDKYGAWKTQMLCLLESHGMFGFIDGTFKNPQTTVSVSGKEKVGDLDSHRLWRRSDALVKGWIFGSLSEQTLTFVLDRIQERNVDFSAKDVWDELQTMYGPSVRPKVPDEVSYKAEQAYVQRRVYNAIRFGSWTVLRNFFKNGVTVIDKITGNGNTALHVAVHTSQEPEFLKKLLEMTPDNTQLLDIRNSDGSTLLHVAAIVGNTEAANILVGKNPDLLLAKDNEGHTPLSLALSNMHTETSLHLLHHINTDLQKDALFSGTSGDELLVTVISSKDFSLAIDLLSRYRKLHSDSVLMAIAQNFPGEPNMLEEFMGSKMEGSRVRRILNSAFGRVVGICALLCGSRVETTLRRGNDKITRCFWLLLRMFVWPFIKERVITHDKALELSRKVCNLLRVSSSNDPSSHHHYYTNPIFEATRQNVYDVVSDIIFFFPKAIWSANEDGHNIIQYAVISRSENVYNLLYQMSEHKNIYRTMKDSYGNNLLHLAARLAPTEKLNIISGAALQIQRELQWFKEVEGFVCPLNIIQKNSFNETPQMVFTREHKDLVIEGEKWMKATAESYTITAALITTIVFAAAITVPGGSDEKTGIPLFSKSTAFKIFAIADAISLFASVTSLLMFLSILTARFAEQDFLFKLPTKLVIGLTTLFISTTAMIVAFGATLYLVFGQSNSRILIPIAVLTCLPITSFVTLQFPLVMDLKSATYGGSIFGKKRDEPFY